MIPEVRQSFSTSKSGRWIIFFLLNEDLPHPLKSQRLTLITPNFLNRWDKSFQRRGVNRFNWIHLFFFTNTSNPYTFPSHLKLCWDIPEIRFPFYLRGTIEMLFKYLYRRLSPSPSHPKKQRKLTTGKRKK